jgi:hypothetical protein
MALSNYNFMKIDAVNAIFKSINEVLSVFFTFCLPLGYILLREYSHILFRVIRFREIHRSKCHTFQLCLYVMLPLHVFSKNKIVKLSF